MQKADVEKVFICNCYQEAIAVRGFDDETTAYVSLWRTKGDVRWRWKQRIKDAWAMLRWGYSADEVMLSQATANALGEYLATWRTDIKSDVQNSSTAPHGPQPE